MNRSSSEPPQIRRKRRLPSDNQADTLISFKIEHLLALSKSLIKDVTIVNQRLTLIEADIQDLNKNVTEVTQRLKAEGEDAIESDIDNDMISERSLQIEQPYVLDSEIPEPRDRKIHRDDIKALIMKACNNRADCVKYLYAGMLKIIHEVCVKYSRVLKSQKTRKTWARLEKREQDKLVGESMVAIVNNHDTMSFLYDCEDQWPVRFLTSHCWNNRSYQMKKKGHFR